MSDMNTIEPDLTHAEAVEAFRAILKDLPSDAYISAGLNLNRFAVRSETMHAYVRPDGHLKGEAISLEGSSWGELIEKVKCTLADRADLRRSNVIRAMALRIIAITADLGECSDRALRAEFDARDVQNYAQAAAEQANELAAGGPFAVLVTEGANEVAA